MLRRSVIALLLLIPTLVFAQGGALGGSDAGNIAKNPALVGVSVDQLLGARIPVDVPLQDETGQTTNPGRLLRGRPLVVLPIFYRCTGVCLEEMQGIMGALANNPKLLPGRDFDLVVLGLNPKETPELAAAKKAEYLEQYGNKATAKGWVFLTSADESQMQRVVNALGIHYTYDRVKDRVNHPSAILVLTPEGRVSTYMQGRIYPAARFAEDVARAAKDELGTKDETTWLGCLHTDPVTGKRSIVVQGVMRLAAVLVVLAILTTMVIQGRRKGVNDADVEPNAQ